jgi:hypothetical protein
LGHPIETSGMIKRQRLNILSPALHAKLSRQLKDAVDDGFIRPSHIGFGLPIIFVRKAYGSLRMCIDYRGRNEVTRKHVHPLLHVDDTLDEPKNANFYSHRDLGYGF